MHRLVLLGQLERRFEVHFFAVPLIKLIPLIMVNLPLRQRLQLSKVQTIHLLILQADLAGQGQGCCHQKIKDDQFIIYHGSLLL